MVQRPSLASNNGIPTKVRSIIIKTLKRLSYLADQRYFPYLVHKSVLPYPEEHKVGLISGGKCCEEMLVTFSVDLDCVGYNQSRLLLSHADDVLTADTQLQQKSTLITRGNAQTNIVRHFLNIIIVRQGFRTLNAHPTLPKPSPHPLSHL